MSSERRVAVVAGLATIASALMYAVDNEWFTGVPDLRVASKTVELAPPIPEASLDAKAENELVTLRPAVTPQPQRAKRSKRRTASRVKARASSRKRTVNIFMAAKDIPHPNTQR